MPEQQKPAKTIEQVLDEFLDEQQARWGHRTCEKYETIIDLLKRYMESYFPDPSASFSAAQLTGK
jgi:hypothetical protein